VSHVLPPAKLVRDAVSALLPLTPCVVASTTHVERAITSSMTVFWHYAITVTRVRDRDHYHSVIVVGMQLLAPFGAANSWATVTAQEVKDPPQSVFVLW